ncbi:MAG: 50S ribosome-binding GTPase [Erysipelotrichaceae bacterium]|nr:50S ribosome-binding GTPase [Erysipelotrichaceae bacterium]
MEELFCIGCGIKLQCEDEEKEGYVNPSSLSRSFILCKRCYQLKHYGKFKESKTIDKTLIKLNENASFSDIIVLLVDVSLLQTPLLKKLRVLNDYHNVYVVANRYDLYSRFIKIEKAYSFLKDSFKKEKINYKKMWIINDNISEIFSYLDEQANDLNIYLLGLENAGKTTFVNQLLKNVAHENNNYLIDSIYPGTTIDLIKIPLSDNTFLIDSPGISSPGNFLNHIEAKYIKNLKNDLKIKQCVFQFYSNQALIVSNVLVLNCNINCKTSVVFYGSNQLELLRCKSENMISTFNNNMKFLKLKSDKISSFNDLEKININIDSDNSVDLVIEGLCFFALTKGSYQIYTLKGVNVYTRKSMIRGNKNDR